MTSKLLCFNYLRPGYMVTKCPSTHNCKQCGKRHHSLLHVDNQHREQQNTTERKTVSDCHTSGNNLCTAISATEPDKTALLGTYRMPLFNHHRQEIICRALIDNGSQLNFVSESFVRRNGFASWISQPNSETSWNSTPIGDERSCSDNFVIAWRKHTKSRFLHHAPSHIRYTSRRCGCTRA